MRQPQILRDAALAEMALAGARRRQGNIAGAWASLARAHVISQPLLGPHISVHREMLMLAAATGNVPEVFGQLVRLLLAPLGHVSGRIPWGNSGLSSISPFKPARLADDIAALYLQAGMRVDNA